MRSPARPAGPSLDCPAGRTQCSAEIGVGWDCASAPRPPSRRHRGPQASRRGLGASLLGAVAAGGAVLRRGVVRRRAGGCARRSERPQGGPLFNRSKWSSFRPDLTRVPGPYARQPASRDRRPSIEDPRWQANALLSKVDKPKESLLTRISGMGVCPPWGEVDGGLGGSPLSLGAFDWLL